MYVVDASVWVSRLVPLDSHHEASRTWFGRRIDEGELVAMPSIVLPEVAGAIAWRTGSPELGSRAVALLQELPTSRLVPVDGPLAVLAAELAARLQLRGADAVYVVLAQRLALPLVTWDREQLARAAGAVTAMTPQEA